MITTREALIKETIERTQATFNGCPNLRVWNDNKDLYFKLHPDYNGELDYVDYYPTTTKYMNSGEPFKGVVKNPSLLNEHFKTSEFKIGSKVKTQLKYETYDGMPVGKFKLINVDTNNEFILDTYRDIERDLMQLVIKDLSSDKDLISALDDKYRKKLSEQYAFKNWHNYSQCYTYYKAVDMGNELLFVGFSSMEELNASIL